MGTPDTIRIWRGVNGMALPKAIIGPSWRLNRDVACWFAIRRQTGTPLVVAADFKAADLLHCDN